MSLEGFVALFCSLLWLAYSVLRTSWSGSASLVSCFGVLPVSVGWSLSVGLKHHFGFIFLVGRLGRRRQRRERYSWRRRRSAGDNPVSQPCAELIDLLIGPLSLHFLFSSTASTTGSGHFRRSDFFTSISLNLCQSSMVVIPGTTISRKATHFF